MEPSGSREKSHWSQTVKCLRLPRVAMHRTSAELCKILTVGKSRNSDNRISIRRASDDHEECGEAQGAGWPDACPSDAILLRNSGDAQRYGHVRRCHQTITTLATTCKPHGGPIRYVPPRYGSLSEAIGDNINPVEASLVVAGVPISSRFRQVDCLFCVRGAYEGKASMEADKRALGWRQALC